ncbi:MAG: molybdenum cofactor guanylyltransferase [Methanosarcinaceae archaeon]|nr:molybdenum cofactor guanylyltransferase [Methanosarcinaceae archaeon]
MCRSSLILAGGLGKRLGFAEKGLIHLEGRTLIEQIINTLAPITDEIIISLRDRSQQEQFRRHLSDHKVVFDQYHHVGPLAGMLEGFKAAKGEYIFVTGCDMPYLDAGVIEYMFERAQGHDAAIPRWDDGRMEPLCAVYRVCSMIAGIETAILDDETFILAPVFKLDDAVDIDVNRIRMLDPDLRTFVNINTQQDLDEHQDHSRRIP